MAKLSTEEHQTGIASDPRQNNRESKKLGLIDVLLDIMVSVLHYLTLPAIMPFTWARKLATLAARAVRMKHEAHGTKQKLLHLHGVAQCAQWNWHIRMRVDLA